MGQESGGGGVGCSMTNGLSAWGEVRLRQGAEQREDTGDSLSASFSRHTAFRPPCVSLVSGASATGAAEHSVCLP